MAASVTPLTIARPLPGDDPLSAATRRLANKSRADSTNAAYRRDWTEFEQWCLTTNRHSLPADPVAVAEFLREQHDAGMAPSTIARRLCAIRHKHIVSAVPSPHAEFLVLEVMKGIRRSRTRKPMQATPLISDQIKQMVDLIDVKTHQGQRDRALLLLGFAAALRRSELVALDVRDLEFVDQGLLVTIVSSKTDQESDGAVIPVPAEPGSSYCPVDALQCWLINSALRNGPLFRRLYRGDTISEHRLSDKSVVMLVKSSAKSIGLDEQLYSGHSLRRGFLTSAAAQKKDLLRMADQARHQNLDTTRKYVDSANAFDQHPGQGLLSEHIDSADTTPDSSSDARCPNLELPETKS